MAILFKGVAAVVGAVAMSTLGGCTNCATDPGQERDPLCAAYNVETGVYKAGDAKIEAEIVRLEARRDLLIAEADRLEADATRLRGERRIAARRLARLNRQTASLNRRVGELSRRADLDQRRVADLRAQEQALSRRMLDASESGNAAEEQRLAAEIAKLDRQINALLGVS